MLKILRGKYIYGIQALIRLSNNHKHMFKSSFILRYFQYFLNASSKRLNSGEVTNGTVTCNLLLLYNKQIYLPVANTLTRSTADPIFSALRVTYQGQRGRGAGQEEGVRGSPSVWLTHTSTRRGRSGTSDWCHQYG